MSTQAMPALTKRHSTRHESLWRFQSILVVLLLRFTIPGACSSSSIDRRRAFSHARRSDPKIEAGVGLRDSHLCLWLCTRKGDGARMGVGVN